MAIRILGTGSYLAEKEVSNDELAKYVDTSDEWISSRTGIKNRRIAVKETTTRLVTLRLLPQQLATHVNMLINLL